MFVHVVICKDHAENCVIELNKQQNHTNTHTHLKKPYCFKYVYNFVLGAFLSYLWIHVRPCAAGWTYLIRL